MLDILTIVHSFADIQTASRIRRVCRRLAVLTPEPKLYHYPDAGIRYEYRVGNKSHRLDGPARINIYGYNDWYRGGIRHREYHPQSTGPGYIEYIVEGEYHREIGPSVIYSESVCWYMRDKLHRKIGPAWDTGCWYTLDKLHRLDGPAYENVYVIRDINHNISSTTDNKWVIDGIVIRS